MSTKNYLYYVVLNNDANDVKPKDRVMDLATAKGKPSVVAMQDLKLVRMILERKLGDNNVMMENTHAHIMSEYLDIHDQLGLNKPRLVETFVING